MTVSTSTVRAVGVTTYGGPDALQVVDVPAQELGPTDVRVRVTAATINPTDTYTRNGSRSKTGTPRGAADVPGMDIAGELVEIGENAQTTLSVGDRVMGIVVPRDEHGAYREDIVLPAQSIAAAPRDADDVAASTLPMNGLTARRALDLLGLKPGEVLAVTGAAGSTGGYVVQLAKHAGLVVVAIRPRPTKSWSGRSAPIRSCAAATASPTASSSSTPTASTASSTEPCRTPPYSPRSRPAAESRRSGGTRATAAATSRSMP